MSPRVLSKIKPQWPLAVTNSMTCPLLSTFPSQSHFARLSKCFLAQTPCLYSNLGSTSRGTKMKHRSFDSQFYIFISCDNFLAFSSVWSFLERPSEARGRSLLPEPGHVHYCIVETRDNVGLRSIASPPRLVLQLPKWLYQLSSLKAACKSELSMCHG